MMLKRIFGNNLEAFRETVGGGSGELRSVHPELTGLYAAAIQQVLKGNLIRITAENENTDILRRDQEMWHRFLGNHETAVHFHRLPWDDPYINNVVSPETAGEKNNLLADVEAGKQITVLTTPAGLNIKFERKKDAQRLRKRVSVRESLTPAQLIDGLEALGYRACGHVAEPGDYVCHGKIVELFPAGLDYPYRVTFDGNGEASTVLSIKRFHRVSRISIEAVAALEIAATVYFETTKSKNTDTLFLTELLPDACIVADDWTALKREYRKLLENFANMRLHHGDADAWPAVNELFTLNHDALKVLDLVPETRPGAAATPPPAMLPDVRTFISLSGDSTAALWENGVTPVFCCDGAEQAENVKKTFGDVEILKGDLPVSLYLPGSHTLYVAYLGRGGRGVDSAQEEGILFDDIEIGDLVVHQTHGIGRFAGFKHIDVDGEAAEFLTIIYQGDAKIYVPVHELDVLSKYVGFQGLEPPLDKIGGTTWEIKKKEARKNIVTFARELLDLYAKRKTITGHVFKPDPEVEGRFVNHFSFVETRGQKAAIKDVLTDLAAPYPMDRLICGDVSFGKTEVALRAAVRVAAARKQVAVLCPTTVLAHQHFNTFKKRFAPFDFTIDVLSRHVPATQRKTVLNRLAAGEIDVIVGTHALLGDAVEFKDPGLFIIDEEQRFGVFQKEKLKQGREHIDVLSLSATPIPRTLSFTVAGLQDVSVIDTPPVGRKAVKNYIGPYCEEMMISAIGKEISREGQAFVIVNHIEGIYEFRDRLCRLMPDITFALIHARMPAEEIEETVFDFIQKKADVLISTTIIENGIDIPNVNTLIIMDAHMFGLTQLYQLRGRIGRGTRQGHTYFFYGQYQTGADGKIAGKRGISEKADQRLEAIREFAQLGAGYKVAEFDLKMRGAGALLGNKQHGHIEALGYDYFLGLLKKTVAQLKGEDMEIPETDFSIAFSFFISPEYITDGKERVHIYKSVLKAQTVGRLWEIKDDVRDRYGEIEPSLLRGFLAQTAKILARFFQFETVELAVDSMGVTLRPVYDQKKEQLTQLIGMLAPRIVSPTEIIFQFDDIDEFMETLGIMLLEFQSSVRENP